MSSSELKNKLLNESIDEETLWEYLEKDFDSTIGMLLNVLYKLLEKVSDNKKQINDILHNLEILSKVLEDNKRIVKVHNELRVLIGNIYKNLDTKTNEYIKGVIDRLHTISGILNRKKKQNNNIEIIEALELIIYENRNLNVIMAFIKDNKKRILKIKDHKEKNILYRLLERYSSLKETNTEEIKYLYQVISLFINDLELSAEISSNLNYYKLAIKNKRLKHTKEIIQELEKHKTTSTGDLARRYRVYVKHPSIVEREIKELEIMSSDVVDFTNQRCFTIDGEETRCLDDAIYFEKNRDGTYTLYVHITYIPALMRYDSKAFEYATKQVETIYLMDEAKSLFPDYISNYRASLLQGQIRYTETGIWLIEPNMIINPDSFKLKKSIIKSHCRLTYDNADMIIGDNSKEYLSQTLGQVGKFALRQKKMNSKKKSNDNLRDDYLDIDLPNASLLSSSVSANIIQVCMMLFGHSTAKLAFDNNIPYINRACEEQRLLRLNNSLVSEIKENNGECTNKVIAYYTTEPITHCALGDVLYSHSSSPARRVPDAENQFCLEHLYFNGNVDDKVRYEWEARLKQHATYYNETIPRIDAFTRHYNYLKTKKLIK